MTDALLLWPLTYLVHSTVLLGGVALASRWIRHPVGSEALWRAAFFGAFVTATLQPLVSSAPSPTMTTAAADGAVERTPALAIAPVRNPGPADAETPVAQQARPLEAAPATPAWRLWLPTRLRPALLATSLAWAVVMLAGLALLLAQWLLLARACRRLRLNTDVAWARAAGEMARRLGLRRVPVLRVGARWASPLVGPGGTVCLPDWCLVQLQGAQRNAVLAHELAHIARRDPAWRLASRVAARIGWLQPLNRLALRRLDALAEQACDARAADAIADRRAVAEALYACASRAPQGARVSRLGVGMAAPRSPLVRRVARLLDAETSPHPRRVPRVAWLALALALAGVALLLPVLRMHGAPLRASEWRELADEMLPSAGPSTHMVMRNPGHEVDVWLRGHAALRADDDGLKSGRVTLRETSDGITRRLDIEAASDGPAVRRYQVDGASHAIDADARQWMARRWTLVVGLLLSPAQRVDRLVARGGPEALMQAIERPADIPTQHELVEAWAGQRTLDDATLQRLIAAVDRAEPAGDDHDRLLSLRAIAARQRLTPALRQQAMAAVAARGEDSESVGALRALLPQLDADTPADLLALAATALRALPSDVARREVLDDALDHGAPTAPVLALQVSPAFSSDYDHRELLEHVARRLAAAGDPALARRFAASARGLTAPFERRTALLALVDATPLDAIACGAVLDALDGLTSTADLTPVLVALARRLPADGALIARYRQLARALPTYERGQTEQALDALPQPA